MDSPIRVDVRIVDNTHLPKSSVDIHGLTDIHADKY